MKIVDLIESKQVNEGPIGSAVGAGLGAMAGGPLGAAAGGAIGNWAGDKLAGLGSKLKGAFSGAKTGFKGQPAPQAAGSVPATGNAPKVDVSGIKAQIAQKKQEIIALQQQLGTPQVQPGIGQANNQVAGISPKVKTPANTMANTPVSKTNTAKPGNPNLAPAVQQTPAEIRAAKQATAAKTAQDQMAANPAPQAPAAQPAAPTPADIRAQKQSTAAQVAQDQMAANPAPEKPVAPNPADIRAQKQAAAAQAAQDQMAANPAPAATPAEKPAVWSNARNPGVTGTSPQEVAPKTQPAQQQPGMTQDGKPQWDPATGQGAKYDGVTGEATPAWKAAQDKQAADAKAASTPPVEPGIGQQQNPVSAIASNTTDPAAAEQEKLAAMQQKNPKLAGLMAQAGMDAAGNDVPAGRPQGGGKVAGQLSDNPRAVKRREQRAIARDQERMATGANESVKFYSRFLGQML